MMGSVNNFKGGTYLPGIAVKKYQCCLATNWKSLGGKAKSKERVTTVKDGKIIKTVAKSRL